MPEPKERTFLPELTSGKKWRVKETTAEREFNNSSESPSVTVPPWTPDGLTVDDADYRLFTLGKSVHSIPEDIYALERASDLWNVVLEEIRVDNIMTNNGVPTGHRHDEILRHLKKQPTDRREMASLYTLLDGIRAGSIHVLRLRNEIAEKLKLSDEEKESIEKSIDLVRKLNKDDWELRDKIAQEINKVFPPDEGGDNGTDQCPCDSCKEARNDSAPELSKTMQKIVSFGDSAEEEEEEEDEEDEDEESEGPSSPGSYYTQSKDGDGTDTRSMTFNMSEAEKEFEQSRKDHNKKSDGKELPPAHGYGGLECHGAMLFHDHITREKKSMAVRLPKGAVTRGIEPVNWHRWCEDKSIFKSRRKGGSILLDCSGSMSWNWNHLHKQVGRMPSLIIGAYAGNEGRSGINGRLCIIAKDGRWSPYDSTFMGGNDVDYEAIMWLAAQKMPRVWVSDGQVCGGTYSRIDDGTSSGRPILYKYINEAMKRYRIIRVRYIEEAEIVLRTGRTNKVTAYRTCRYDGG